MPAHQGEKGYAQASPTERSVDAEEEEEPQAILDARLIWGDLVESEANQELRKSMARHQGMS